MIIGRLARARRHSLGPRVSLSAVGVAWSKPIIDTNRFIIDKLRVRHITARYIDF